MRINHLSLLSGARAARGLTVVIDVFRAFSLEAYLFDRGAARIFAVGSEAAARALKKAQPDALLVGERGGAILPGFDFGNSPSQTACGHFAGKTVIHTTSAGTQGLVAASASPDVTQVITGSLVNAAAIARYIAESGADEVSLVAMGWNGTQRTTEDELCSRLIASYLGEEPLDLVSELAAVRAAPEGAKFFAPEKQSVFPEADFHMCTAVDLFDFVITAEKVDDEIFLMRRQGSTADA